MVSINQRKDIIIQIQLGQIPLEFYLNKLYKSNIMDSWIVSFLFDV